MGRRITESQHANRLPHVLVMPIQGEARRPTYHAYGINHQAEKPADRITDLGGFTKREDAFIAGRAWRDTVHV